MKITYPPSMSLSYMDRNASIKSLAWSNFAVAPHVSVEHASYTVPANKRAIITHVFAHIMRHAVADTPDLAIFRVGYTFMATNIPLAHLLMLSNTVGYTEWVGYGPQILLVANQKVYIDSADASINGSFDFAGSVSIIEFDA